jgi:O-antigen/teichoic acid export membrane protein
MTTSRKINNVRHGAPITPKQAIMMTLIGIIGGIVIVVISNLFFYVALEKACTWYVIGVFFAIAFPWASLKRETRNRSIRAHNRFIIFAVIVFIAVIVVQWRTEHQPFPVWGIILLILGGCIAYSVIAYYAVHNFFKWCKGELEASNTEES